MELIDFVHREMGCLYLSDLHKPELHGQLWKVVQELVWGRYPLREWNELLGYVTGRQESCASELEARQCLRTVLEDTVKGGEGLYGNAKTARPKKGVLRHAKISQAVTLIRGGRGTAGTH